MTCLLSVITTRNFLVTFLHCVASWKLLPLPFWAWTFIVIQDGFFLLNINICSLDRWGFCSNTPIVFACWWKKGEVKNNPVIQKDVNPETPDYLIADELCAGMSEHPAKPHTCISPTVEQSHPRLDCIIFTSICLCWMIYAWSKSRICLCSGIKFCIFFLFFFHL